MNISILTLFPQLYETFFDTSLFKKAREAGRLSFSTHSLFDYVKVKQRIDAPTFGHSSGMLIKPSVVEAAMEDVDEVYGKSFKIIMSPQGKKLDQKMAKELWNKIKDCEHVSFLASRYEGIDARVEEYYADEVVSVGDFVTMGGDIPVMLLMEALFRHMPGVVGKQESVDLDSFSGAFVDHPEYTRPVEWKGMIVPEVLRSGNHAAINKWRKEKAAKRTVKEHFDWLRLSKLKKDDIKLVRNYIPRHYVALLHDDMLLKGGRIGTTSVTSIDIHDIARSASTYGVKNFFISTSLKDQFAMIQKMMNFWQESTAGGEYNKDRHNALKVVVLERSLQNVIDQVEKLDGKKPIIIGTSAVEAGDIDILNYHQQDIVWREDRPVLILFGTGQGMSEKLLKRCDYMLQAVGGYSSFNHLSVRSAAAIVLDKWLGISLK